MNTFENTGLGENILKAIASLGFEKMTPIQESTIPILMTSDQDIIATAQTGTGNFISGIGYTKTSFSEAF